MVSSETTVYIKYAIIQDFFYTIMRHCLPNIFLFGYYLVNLSNKTCIYAAIMLGMCYVFMSNMQCGNYINSYNYCVVAYE